MQTTLATFKIRLEQRIDSHYHQIINLKPADQKCLSYQDVLALCHDARSFTRAQLHNVPADVEAACEAASAILAPDTVARIKHLKAMAAAGGTAAGIAAILAALAAIFGWGAGVVAAIHAFLFGVSLTGPIGLFVGGVTVATIAVYWALTSDAEDRSAKAFRALKEGCAKAIEHSQPAELSKACPA
jgi:hypothetical protein